VRPCLPIVLVERIFDRNNGVLVNIFEVQVGEFGPGYPFLGVRVGVLEIQIVFAVLVELGRGNIEGDLNFALVTRPLDGLAYKLE